MIRTTMMLMVGVLATACAHEDAAPEPSTARANADPIQVTDVRPGAANAQAGTPLSTAPLDEPADQADTTPAPPDAPAMPTMGTSSPTPPAASDPPVVAETHPYTTRPAGTPATPRTSTDGTRVTAMSQSNAPGDLKLVAAIRRSISGDASLSFMAKNVTVVTSGGNVALRGTVHSKQERDRIESLAMAQAGVGKIDDGIAVRP